MRNFLADIVKPMPKDAPANYPFLGLGLGMPVVEGLNQMLRKGLELGFSQDQATRAVALWLMDIAWTSITRETSIMQQAMLTVVPKDFSAPPPPTGPSSPVVQQGQVDDHALNSPVAM